jgi:glycyl-tRNA synthetase beta chain
VREFTELQGTMGGIYAREEGLPEAVWKAIYYHYLPIGVETGGPPTREHLGAAGLTWAAVSLADKIDSAVGLFSAGERPTGTRDPFGLRRQVQGAVKVLVDLPELAGVDVAVDVLAVAAAALRQFPAPQAPGPPAPGEASPGAAEAPPAFWGEFRTFVIDRVRHLYTQRGFRPDEIDAALGASGEALAPLAVRRRLEALQALRGSEDFAGLAALFKRVKNIAKEISATPRPHYDAALDRGRLTEPAEVALLAEFDQRAPGIRAAIDAGHYRQAMAEAAALRPAVDRFFTEVFVMTDDAAVRTSRLMLMVELRDLVLRVADISALAG